MNAREYLNQAYRLNECKGVIKMNETTNQPNSIIEIAQGKTMEYIDKATRDIINNITDPDTTPTTVRELLINVKFKPNEDRDEITVTYAVDKKIVKVKDVDAVLEIDYTDDGGKIVKEGLSGGQTIIDGTMLPPKVLKI